MIKLLKKIRDRHKATTQNEGQRWAVLMNPQGVEAFNEKPIWWKGIIEDVTNDGFILNFDGKGYMVCQSLKKLKRIN